MHQTIDDVIRNVALHVRGKDEQIRLALCCLLADGHLLLDDVPGTGKTSMAKAIAGSISGEWKRVQFTPDLLPTDVTGVMVYQQSDHQFTFRPGPVFTNVLICDEINRGSPKTQSALLEVMEERQVTVDGNSRAVPTPFFVIATQNPRDSQGTFPLPDVQLDRFAMRLSVGYTDPETEAAVLDSYTRRGHTAGVVAVTNVGEIDRVISEIDRIDVAPAITRYITAIANETRQHPDLRLGASTRATIALLRVVRAHAASDHRDYVLPEDVKATVSAVFGHRISVAPEAELRGVTATDVIAEVVEEVPVPRTRDV